MIDIDSASLETLARWDTPTICNALEIVTPERRGAGYTIRHMICLDPALPPIVGYARTATFRAAAPSPHPGEVVRARRADYYEYIGSSPMPTVTVIQDLDPSPGYGAFWGEVNTAVHKALGSLGAVTNGSMRDLDACAPGFQLLAGMVGPSHAFGHVEEFGIDVEVFGMRVSHDDIIHADRHGAVVIPREALGGLPAAVDLLTRREAVILDVARGEHFDIDRLKQAMAESAEIH